MSVDTGSGGLAGRPRLAPAIVAGGAVAALAIAFAFQYGAGLRPCVLCVYQRYPYGVVIVLAAASLLVDGRWRALLLGLAAVALLVDAGIAGFHVGVEMGWWEGTTSCGGGGGATTLEALKQQVMSAPLVRCDEVAWSFLGLSMAAWNGLFALALAGVAAAGARRSGRGGVA